MCRLLLFVPGALIFSLCSLSLILPVESLSPNLGLNLHQDLDLDSDSDGLLKSAKNLNCLLPPYPDPEHSIPEDFKYPNFDPDDEFMSSLLQSLTQPPHPDISLTVPQLIVKYGYPLEIHQIITEKGYILTAYRIPWGKSSISKIPGRPVMFQHGLLAYSSCWVASVPKDIFALADRGFDCWLINARGTIPSQKHKTLDPTQPEFWDFSWEDMGRYDIPSCIDFILAMTGYKKIIYIGHSMGTTMFFAGMPLRPDYCDKVALMVALAPVGYLHRSTSLIRLAAPAEILLAAGSPLYDPVVPGRLMPNELVDILSMYFFGYGCTNPTVAELICLQPIFLLVGYDFRETNMTQLPVALAHLLNPTSLKCLRHYAQLMLHNRFSRFDHGPLENLKRYGQCTPPDYKISAISCPVAFISSHNDALANEKDVEKLSKLFPNLVLHHTIPEYPCWNHIDYFTGVHIRPAYLDVVLGVVKKYAPDCI